MRRVAAIDVGTNTVLCLVADVHPDGRLDVLTDEERFARLGEGVDASGRLSEAAMARVLDRLAASKATAARFGAEAVVIGATSASRDAANADDLRARVHEALGLDYRVRSGEDEATLGFQGALALLPGVEAACVLDIGGGSTELIVGRRGEAPSYRISLNVGSVRLTERCLQPLPPSPAHMAEAEAAVADALAVVPAAAVAGRTLVESGGTARVLTHLLGEDGHAPVIPRTTVRAWRERLLRLAPEAVRALAPEVLTGREDVFGAALLILDAVMTRFGFDAFVAGRGGFRHGLALEVAEAL